MDAASGLLPPPPGPAAGGQPQGRARPQERGLPYLPVPAPTGSPSARLARPGRARPSSRRPSGGAWSGRCRRVPSAPCRAACGPSPCGPATSRGRGSAASAAPPPAPPRSARRERPSGLSGGRSRGRAGRRRGRCAGARTRDRRPAGSCPTPPPPLRGAGGRPLRPPSECGPGGNGRRAGRAPPLRPGSGP